MQGLSANLLKFYGSPFLNETIADVAKIRTAYLHMNEAPPNNTPIVS